MREIWLGVSFLTPAAVLDSVTTLEKYRKLKLGGPRRTMATFCRVALLVCALFLCSANSVLFAQGFGAIVGTVNDPSGAVIASAEVKITEPATGQVRDVTTNAQGYYVVPSLKPSQYDVSISAPGLAPFTQTGITLQADQNVTINTTLSLTKSNQSVDVSADVSQVNTTSATLSEVVDQRRVVDLPLNGRNAASLLLVVAGATPAPARDADQGNDKTYPSVVTVSTNGSRQNQISFRLDGSNNNDLYTNVNQPFPFPDALQEFSVQTSNYSAKFGGNAGGVVNVVTKSGTNEIHGSGFNFVRNAVFNARPFFGNSRDQLKRNQFGGTFGGPIFIPKLYDGRNKTFFFFGYQGTRIRNVTSTSNATVPTDAELRGDFSALLNPSSPANPFGRRIQINDPVTRQPFPNNQINPGRFDPAALAFTRYLPRSSTNGIIFYSQPVSQDFNEYLGRVDHSFSEKDRLVGRYFDAKFGNTAYLDPANYLSYQNFSTITSQNAMIGETHIFGPRALNDFRVSFSREIANRGPAPGSINLSDLGVSIYQPQVKYIEGINVNNYFNAAQTSPAAFIRNQYGINEDFSIVLGKHNLSFGGQALRGQVLLRNQFRVAGLSSFTVDNTNDALASFMLGYARTFTQGFGEFKDNIVNLYNLYVQDDFHVSRRLTINMGLRYDPQFPWQEKRNRVEQFRVDGYLAGTRSQVYTNAPPGLLFPGDPGMPEWGTKANYTNVAPRVGFAYDVSGDGRTSIRGGAGVYYDAIQSGIVNNRFVNVTPFSPQFSVTQPRAPFSNPYLGSVNPYPAPFPPPSNAPFPGPILAITYDPSNNNVQQTPVVYNWNFIVERQLASSWVGRVAYVGSQSRHLLQSMELNPSIYRAGSTLGPDARRQFQPYGSITQATQDVNSGYNSLQFTLQKRLSQGFSLLANYTWSKSIDTLPFNQNIATIVQGGSSPIPWNMAGRRAVDRGPSEFDRTHRFVVSYVWDLPKLNNLNPFVKGFIGGWQLTGIVTAQTGGPLTALAGVDRSGTALGTDRANYTGVDPYGANACAGAGRCVGYLNPQAFGLAPLGGFGNVGKGSLRGPGLVTWDAGLFKEIPVKERLRFQFRAEFFNLLNHANFSDPNTTLSANNFGRILATSDPRIGQLALKVLF